MEAEVWPSESLLKAEGSVFFSYIGFDVLATLSTEARRLLGLGVGTVVRMGDGESLHVFVGFLFFFSEIDFCWGPIYGLIISRPLLILLFLASGRQIHS